MLAPIGLLWGEGRAANYARYWLADAVAADDGVGYVLDVESNDAAPAGLGGECAFTMAYLTVRAAASCVLRVTPILNDNQSLTRAHPTGTITVLQPTIAIPQQLGGPPTPMYTQTFPIPLLFRFAQSGKPQQTFHPRGERCRIRIESIGAIGTGPLRIEQVELEYEVIRRSEFNPFTPS